MVQRIAWECRSKGAPELEQDKTIHQLAAPKGDFTRPEELLKQNDKIRLQMLVNKEPNLAKKWAKMPVKIVDLYMRVLTHKRPFKPDKAHTHINSAFPLKPV